MEVKTILIGPSTYIIDQEQHAKAHYGSITASYQRKNYEITNIEIINY